jgi:hypothetical protein
VRIAAVPQTDTLEETAAGPTLSSIAETDAEGRYRLEDVPPGRYFIAAGRLDFPTYFPGTQSMALGRAVLITPGLRVADIDFALNANSAGRAEAGSNQGIVVLTTPVDVRVEGGGKLPVVNNGKPTTIQLTPVTGPSSPVTIAINAGRLNLSPPVLDYRVSVENLPEGYTVKSIKAGSTELANRVLSLSGAGNPTATVVSPPPSASTASIAVTAFTPATRTAYNLQSISIVLDSTGVSSVRNSGARVTGKLPPSTIRPLYLAGTPATVFSDGTFEFRNVPAGRHTIVTQDHSPSLAPLAAVVFVGTDDVAGVEVVRTPTLPLNSQKSPAANPAVARNSAVLRLPALRGIIVDAETGATVTGGTVFVVGETWSKFDLGPDGKFEFQNLLPGRYELEVQGLGYPTFRRSFEMIEVDLNLAFRTN